MALIENFFSDEGAIDTRCAECGASIKCKSGALTPVGKGNRGILIVLEAVDNQADRYGAITGSGHYKFLQTELAKFGINIYQDCWVVASVRCLLGKKPTKADAMKCRYLFEEDVKSLKPNYIWTFGNIPLGHITDKYRRGIQADQCYGDRIPLNEFECYLFPFLGVPEIQSRKKDANFQAVHKRTMQNAVDDLEEYAEFQKINVLRPVDVTFLTDADSVITTLEDLMAIGGPQAIDYEATGLKPYADGHKITTIGITYGGGTYAFPIDYQDYWNLEDWNYICDAMEAYLSSPNVYHIAHNKNFENLWGKVLLGSTKYVNYCTLVAQHVIDHRKRTKGLKYQSFIRWGVGDYDKSMAPYIKGKTANSFNKMDDAPLPAQLLYVGYDTILTYKLWEEQQVYFNTRPHLKEACEFFMESIDSMSAMQDEGLLIDTDYYDKIEIELEDTIRGLEKSIQAHDDVVAYRKKYKREFKMNSTPDLQHLLFDQLGYDSLSETAGGAKAVDAALLKEINTPLTKYLLDLRKYTKLKDTYLAQFKREVTDGKMIHPFFLLSTVTSYRSSCMNPNWQNIPKRDKESKMLIRTGIVPSKGNMIGEIDFSGMEVSMSATYHKDPTFINYLLDDNADMHRDNGCDIWQIPQSEMTGDIRTEIKGGWTFPQFYGDWYQSCGQALWKSSLHLPLASGILLKDHLHDIGIKREEDFLEHCKTAEQIMWEERFPVYTQWKKDINDLYIREGYVETHLGFRFTGLMDRKQTANFPVQGTAFHLLLWCLNLLRAEKKNYGWKSRFIGQVHDSVIIDFVPEEVAEIVSVFKHHVSVTLPKTFPWAAVAPFRIDVELSKINGTFAELYEYKS